MSLFDLTGKVAVVTGSSRGIGRAIALHLAQAGAKVVVSSRKEASCAEVADAITQAGGEAMVVPCNISEMAQLKNLADQTISAWGGIDILVCNAASNPYYGPLADISEEAYDKTMDNNVKSNLWLANMCAPSMAARGGGAIMIVSSVAAFKGSDTLGAYTISKAADLGLIRSLAKELGPKNIRVNGIAPGVIKTDFARALWENPKISAATIAATDLKRLGDPDDIAGAAVYLASRAGAYMTGDTMIIDGGMITT